MKDLSVYDGIYADLRAVNISQLYELTEANRLYVINDEITARVKALISVLYKTPNSEVIVTPVYTYQWLYKLKKDQLVNSSKVRITNDYYLTEEEVIRSHTNSEGMCLIEVVGKYEDSRLIWDQSIPICKMCDRASEIWKSVQNSEGISPEPDDSLSTNNDLLSEGETNYSVQKCEVPEDWEHDVNYDNLCAPPLFSYQDTFNKECMDDGCVKDGVECDWYRNGKCIKPTFFSEGIKVIEKNIEEIKGSLFLEGSNEGGKVIFEVYGNDPKYQTTERLIYRKKISELNKKISELNKKIEELTDKKI